MIDRFNRRIFPALLLMTGALHGQDTPPNAEERMKLYLKNEVERVEAEFFEKIKTKEDWEKLRPELHRQYLEMLGLYPLPERSPLNAQVVGTAKKNGVAVERLHFQSLPHLYVTGNLYRPENPAGKLPAILYACGHWDRGRDGNKSVFQHHGFWFASHGYVCLIIDTLQLGEAAGIHHGTYRHNRWWWHARGYTPAGVECWNGMRALDYLQSRPEVDGGKIAVTGISGGGASSFWIAAAEERIQVAVPVSGMSDLDTYVNEQVVNGHCDCMFLYNAHRWSWLGIAMLVAPRPLLFENSDSDGIFPMPANHRISSRLREFYKLLGVPQNVGEVVAAGGHADKLALRIQSYQWINRFLKGDNAEVSEPAYELFPGAELRAFPGDLPSDAVNGKIDELFVPRARLEPPRLPADFMAAKSRVLAELQRLSLGSPEQEFPVRSFPSPARLAPGAQEVWLLVLNAGEEAADLEWAKAWAGSIRQVVPFAPRGAGENAFPEKAPWTVRRSLALLGRTLDNGRLRDVARAAEALRGGNAQIALGVVGRKQAGVIGAYAALFSSAIDQAAVIDPPASHSEGPVFLNVLRICDIGDALGLLAPKGLQITTENQEMIDRVKAYYQAAGAAQKFVAATNF